MKTSCCKDNRAVHNSSIRTDLPLTVVGRSRRKMVEAMLRPGQLFCVGELYLRTQGGLLKIRVA